MIDAVIALSVIYKGFDNNGGFQKYFDSDSPNLLWAVFLFGLLHVFVSVLMLLGRETKTLRIAIVVIAVQLHQQ